MPDAVASKERPILFSGSMVRAILEGRKTQTRRIVNFLKSSADEEYARHVDRHQGKSCKYGTAGDRLWVRETHFVNHPNGDVWYRADQNPQHDLDLEAKAERWRPSIFMPRWASRLTLEIVSVRVERLQDISEADAIAEGIETTCPCSGGCDQHRKDYRALWESINGAGSWDLNPWVWVVEFKRVEAPNA